MEKEEGQIQIADKHEKHQLEPPFKRAKSVDMAGSFVPRQERSGSSDGESDGAECGSIASDQSDQDEVQIDEEETENEEDKLFSEEEAEILRYKARNDGLRAFIEEQIALETPLPKLARAFGFRLPSGVKNLPLEMQWSIFANLLKRFCQTRMKLPQYNTLDDTVELIKRSSKILVLTGAGISVSCGIPDFRSEQGLYHIISQKYPELDDPQLMFDIEFFRYNHLPFFELAKEIFPSNFQPSPTHRFLKLLETRGKLLRNYTQNIDTLEKLVGLFRVIHCHGSFDTATCQKCGFKVDGLNIKDDILHQRTPFCPKCSKTTATTISRKTKPKKYDIDDDEKDEEDDEILPIMKPDIVFFGEKLPDEFDRAIEMDRAEADLMIVVGSSLKVAPVNHLVGYIPHNVPLILINREPIYHLHKSFDIQLLGYCDDIIEELCRRLEWDLYEKEQRDLTMDKNETHPYDHVPPNIHLFHGNLFDHGKHHLIMNNMVEINPYSSSSEEEEEDDQYH